MLPIPKNKPDVTAGEVDDDFFDIDAPEDEKLLATGQWDDDEENDEI